MPTEPLGRDHWLHAPRFPLGEAYRGICHAAAEPFIPPESSLEQMCNCGYARGRCERFPNNAADAVRFSIISEDDVRIRVVYVLERDHSPESHRAIEYSKSSGRAEGGAENIDVRLTTQLRAFLGTHLRNARAARSQADESPIKPDSGS